MRRPGAPPDARRSLSPTERAAIIVSCGRWPRLLPVTVRVCPPMKTEGEDTLIGFGSIDWTDDVAGIRARESEVEGERWAIVEYAPKARREEWCLDGHAGFVLAGAVEYEFQDGAQPFDGARGRSVPPSDGACTSRRESRARSHSFVLD